MFLIEIRNQSANTQSFADWHRTWRENVVKKLYIKKERRKTKEEKKIKKTCTCCFATLSHYYDCDYDISQDSKKKKLQKTVDKKVAFCMLCVVEEGELSRRAEAVLIINHIYHIYRGNPAG